MLAHRGRLPATLGTAIDAAHVADFAQALMARSAEPARELLDAHLDRGVGLQAIFLQLMTPTAHYLGELWEADLCNFSQVTLCLWRLQSMLHDLSPSFQSGANRTTADRSAERRILMTTMTGQQHTFGLSILSEFFRREGWVVLSIPSPEPGETQSTLSRHWFDVLALSASMEGETDDLTRTIQAARKTSQNPRLSVIVGGPLFQRNPGLADEIGADGFSGDAEEALSLAGHLIQQQREFRLN